MVWAESLFADGQGAALVRLGVPKSIEPAQYFSETQQSRGDLLGVDAIFTFGQHQGLFRQRQCFDVLLGPDELRNLPLERFELELALGQRTERQKSPNQRGGLKGDQPCCYVIAHRAYPAPAMPDRGQITGRRGTCKALKQHCPTFLLRY